MNYVVLPKRFILFVLISLSFSFAVDVDAQNMFRKVNDFDGDGKADYAVTRNLNGQRIWYIWQSTAGFKAVQWGLNFDIDASGDYDGDGKTDIAIYREPTSFPPVYTFWVLQSQTNTFVKTEFTTISNQGSAAMHQDYNGDGKTDPAVWLGEFGLMTQVRIRHSGTSSGNTFSIPARDVPIRIGDMDGGNSADNAHYSLTGNVVTITSIETNASRSGQFGTSDDIYLAADFDGDAIGDLTIWRRSDGNWWWIKSSDNTVNVANWGISGDRPVPADYDGDGKTDRAIWRNGTYWVNGSQNGISTFNWGIMSDNPVEY